MLTIYIYPKGMKETESPIQMIIKAEDFPRVLAMGENGMVKSVNTEDGEPTFVDFCDGKLVCEESDYVLKQIHMG